jgi:hypothetical protein
MKKTVIPASTDAVTSTANQAASVALAAIPGKARVIHAVVASYSGSPTGGMLSIVRNTDTVLSTHIGAAPLVIPFSPPLAGQPGDSLMITLAAGGSGVIGKLSVLHNFE